MDLTTLFLLVFLLVLPKLEGQASELTNKLSDNLFGKSLWKLSEFCADTRDGSTILAEDETIEMYYNGSALESVKSQGQSVQNEIEYLLYLGTRARIALTVMCSINSWSYADKSTFELSNLPLDDPTKCHKLIDQLYYATKRLMNVSETSAKSLNQTLDSNDDLFSYWFKLNSFGRAPSNHVFMHHIWIGDYKECTKFSSMRFCYAAYKPPSWPDESSPLTTNAIRIGICLPRFCNSEVAKLKGNLEKIDLMIKYNLINGMNRDNHHMAYKLTNVFCPPADDSLYRMPFRETLSKVLAGIALMWCLLLLFASSPLGESIGSKLVGDFNFKSLWRRFIRSDHLDSKLVGLNAIKVMAMWWIMSTHFYMILTSVMTNHKDVRDKLQYSPIGAILLQAQHAVSGFFVISGLLAGIKAENKSFLRQIFNRYCRLVPMYLVVYAFVKQFAHLIGTGPIWDHGVSIESESRQCRIESWLTPILLLSNFVNPFAHCILTGWHLAVDFQVHLALPLLLYAYKRSKAKGRLLGVFIFLATHLYHAWNFYSATKYSFTQLSHEPYMFGPRIIVGRLDYDYMNPIGRLGTFFIGFVLADLLSVRHGENEQVSLVNGGGGDGIEMKMKTGSRNNLETGMFSKNSEDNSTYEQQQQQQVASSDTTDRMTIFDKFKDNKYLCLAGLSLLGGPVLSPAIPERFKGRLEKVSPLVRQAVVYPILRLIVELGWFFIIYSLLSRNNNNKTTKSTINIKNNNTKAADNGRQQQKAPNNKYGSLSTGIGDSLVGFLGSPVWNILAKLNFCLMLTHFPLARYLVHSQTELLVFSWISFFQLTTSIILMCYLTSFVLHLTIEMPLSSLIKRLGC